MFNRRYLLLILILTALLFSVETFACTTAIVSGKYTKDGRPLLFKHRDTGTLQNKLMFFSDGKYEYIGLVNSDDAEGESVWAGLNSAGFAIMNSASYNLNLKDTTSLKDREGIVMKRALQICGTVDDFETLLDTLPKPLGVEANFGVIDAKGNAAYFETGNFDFRKFDVNDRGTALFGYIIRTNYSYSLDADQGYGYIRYQNAQQLFNMAAATNNLCYEFILKDVSRCLKNSMTNVDLRKNLPANGRDPVMVNFRDFIVRNSSASTVVVHSVKPGESPEYATMWTILGFQLCTPAMPVWVKGGDQLPAPLIADETGTAPLCDLALKLKEKCLPITRGSGKYYLNHAAVINEEGTGILQKLIPIEHVIFQKAHHEMEKWRETGLEKKNILNFYQWLDDQIFVDYQNTFGF